MMMLGYIMVLTGNIWAQRYGRHHKPVRLRLSSSLGREKPNMGVSYQL